MEKLKLGGKTRQSAENKQTLGILLIYFPNHCSYSLFILDFHIPSLKTYFDVKNYVLLGQMWICIST